MRIMSLFRVVAIGGAVLAGVGCGVAKDARIAAENAIDPPASQQFTWGRIECGHGQVCSEVEVARVDVVRDGPVEITLQNKTLEHVAVQVGIETFAGDVRTDRTGFHDVALAPRQQSVLVLWQDIDANEKIVIHLRARS